MLRGNPDLSDKPSKSIIRWRYAGLSWEDMQFDEDDNGHLDLDVFFGHRPTNVGDFDIFLVERDEVINISSGRLCPASFDIWPHSDSIRIWKMIFTCKVVQWL